MTLRDCLSLADLLRPNALPAEIKCRWLSELEGRIALELRGETEPPAPFSPASPDTRLAVPFPYDQLYWMYLAALIDLASDDRTRYAYSASLFNSAYQSYAKYLIRRE